MNNLTHTYCLSFYFIKSIFMMMGLGYEGGDREEIILYKKDAVAWLSNQTIYGRISGSNEQKITVHHDQSSFLVDVKKDNTFQFTVVLHDSLNKIWAEARNLQSGILSDTINLTLGYHPLPVVKPIALIKGDSVSLKAEIIENHTTVRLRFYWITDKRNPAPCKIIDKYSSTTKVQLPDRTGTYYFNLLVISGKDTSRLTTFVTKNHKTLDAFDIDNEYAEWIDDAVVYCIKPRSFVNNGCFKDIQEKLPEIKKLGINTIWLQPISKSFQGGQGYDVIDYFSISQDLGTERDLKNLVATAKSMSIRVLLDIVPNHTSIYHPYAVDCIRNGRKSHYYNFYQHDIDGSPYSSFYNKDHQGFIYYFWKNLVNLNYQNEEVQRWMIEVCKYWLTKYDIDGYRFDAVWAVNARNSSFAKRLRMELKAIKPDILLLAEDKGSDPEVYKKGFDVAYDWTLDTGWVSQWSWQYKYHERENFSIFNFPDVSKRVAMLNEALFRNANAGYPRLRFIENNDLPRFIRAHGKERTKMASALLFALPGVPMLYNGQEIGVSAHPYSRKPIFLADNSIQSLDSNGLFNYYQKLIYTRKQYSSLRSKEILPLPVSGQAPILAFIRQKGRESFIVIINLDSVAVNANLKLSKAARINGSSKNSEFKDLLSDEIFIRNKNPAAEITIPMKGYSVRWLLLAG